MSIQAGGHRGASDTQPVDPQTVFEAASLTKPLVSFIALQLAGERRLDLAAPLESLCGPYVPDDPRAAAITAACLLAECVKPMLLARVLTAPHRKRKSRPP